MELGTSGFLYGRFSEISSKIQVKRNLQTGLVGGHCMRSDGGSVAAHDE